MWSRWYRLRPILARRLDKERTRVILWLFVDAAGDVRNTRVAKSSGVEYVDRRIVEFATGMRFEPARNYGGITAVWIQQPFIIPKQ